MREILFKAKRIDNGEWVEGAYCPSSLDSLLGEMQPKPNIIKLGGEYDGFWFEVIPETVSQYTGLTDKNGKKIFEGDIVANQFDHSIRATIIYNHVSFCYMWDKYTASIRRCEYEPMFTNTDIVMEVIGNIHDKGGVTI